MAENINGALAFRASLDIDDFNMSADAMERHIRRVSTTAVQESELMEQSILNFAQNGAKYIIGTLVGGGMTALVNSIVQTRGQFQQLEIAFETMLGSGAKAKNLMDQLVDTAAKTPFDLTGVAGGAKQLLAYGTAADKVNDTLVRLGNIASGLSIPLNDIVYLYGTTMVQGRLYAQDVRQFTGRGIPLVRELAEMYGKTAEEINEMVSAGKIGFADVEKVINKMTNSGGQFYNLMEKQSASLTGMIANLGDAWDMALNKLGQDNQDVFAKGIEGATYLVEHLDEILQIVKAVAIGYGTYKAAVIVNTLATKGYTGVALIDNTVRQAKIALLKFDEQATGKVAAQTALMTVAEKANTATLEAQLTTEERANVVKSIRIATIQNLLTAQQQEYLSNLGLTVSSQGYEAAALQVLNVEQRQALSKLDLSSKSAVYRAALAQEVASKNQNTAATLETMRTEVKAAAVRVEAAKQTAIATMQATKATRYEVYWAKQSGDATMIQTAEKKYLAAVENQSIARKAALAAQTDFHTKKKLLETTATRQGTAAGAADIAVKNAQTVSTNILSVATNKLKLAFQTLVQSFKANPFGWIITGIGLAISAFSYFTNKTKETETELQGLEKVTSDTNKQFAEQSAKVEILQKKIDNSNLSYHTRNEAIKELKSIVPEYHAQLTTEGELINNNTDAIEKYLVALKKSIMLKAAEDNMIDLTRKQLEQQLRKDDIKIRLGELESERNAKNAKNDNPFTFAGQSKEELKLKKELEELDPQLEKTTDNIDKLTEKYAKLIEENKQSGDSIKKYSEQLKEAKEKVKSIENEIKDLRSGKVEKDNLAGEIESKMKELNDAKGKLAALTGKTPKSESDALKNQQQLNDKQIEADLKLEEARIEVMEEGYGKRKAILDLQHKKNLYAIEKEQRELEKARKEAGKSGLNDTEKQQFSERKSIETQKYDNDTRKLFNEEIEYQKNQYQLYLRWVQAMDKDAADKRFSKLLEGGTSYKEWLQQQIAEMESKGIDNLATGDKDNLFTMKSQLNEIDGAKSAMDRFKESISQTIGQASTLAERIKAIEDAKERLNNGDGYGLISADDKAAGNLDLNKQGDDAQKELQNTVIKDYQNFEEKKKSIREQYDLLRQEAIRTGNTNALSEINKGEAEALSTLNAQMLMQNESWKNLFTDLDALTVEQIDKLIGEIQEKMSTADLNLNPEDMKAILDMLDEAKKKILDVNPFKALGKAVLSVFGTAEQKSKNSSGDIKRDWKNLAKATEGCFDFVNDAIDSCDVLGDLIGDTGKATIQMLQGIVTAGIAMSAAIKTAEKGSVILTVISLALQAIQWIATLFNKDNKLEERIQNIQKGIDALSNSFDRLSNAISHTYWEFSPEEKEAQQQRLDSINQQIDALEKQRAVAITSWNFVEYATLTKQLKDLKYALEKTEQSGDMFQLYELQKQNLKEQQELIKQQIEAEKDKKKSDSGKIADWEEKIKDIDTQLEDLERSMIETLAGTDVKSAIDEFADALVEAYVKGEDAAEALGEVTKNVMKKAVVEAIKRQFLAKAINDAVDFLGKSMEDGTLSDNERAKFEQMVNAAGEATNKALEAVGDWIKDIQEDTTDDPLTGAIQAMSEETGSVVAGRLNAVIINQSDSLSVLRQSLIYHAEIAANTRYNKNLEGIYQVLNEMKNNNSLLSQGIS